MPTIQDKTILQAQNPSKVFLFKEGIFYKAYNQGAYLMRHKNYKVNVKKIKNIENEVVSIGFPSTVFEALIYDFAIQDLEFNNLKLKTLLKKQLNLLYNYGYFTSNLNIYKIKNNEL